jgi:hypothetical protein
MGVADLAIDVAGGEAGGRDGERLMVKDKGLLIFSRGKELVCVAKVPR